MRSLIPLLKQLSLRAKALTAGVVLAALLASALPAPGRGRRAHPHFASRLAAGAPVTMAPRLQPASPLVLTALRIGPQPAAVPGRSIATTFITDDPASCRVVAGARLADAPGTESIRWTVQAPPGFQAPPDARWTGSRLDVTFRRPGGNPDGQGGPLSFSVEARATLSGLDRAARLTVTQDEIDQLRQEYVDLQRRRVPDRSEFIDAAAFETRFGHRYPWLRFDDLNWSLNPRTGLRYSWAIIRPELLEGLEQVRQAYGPVIINSGYRNPLHQVEVNAPIRESLHQYGYAADLAVIPGKGRALPNEVDWRRLAEAACTARAKWVEPLDSSAPNSPGCHVHLDYRPGLASSAPVHLHGQVVAAKTGRPVAGALVLLGAMPARTNADGVFGIRTVLGGGMHAVEVRAAGFEVLSQPVRLAAWGTTFARLALEPAANRAFLVEAARVSWVDRRRQLLAATLRVSNTSGAVASEVRLSVLPAAATLIRQDPIELGTLPPAAVRGVRVLLRVPATPAPEPLAISLAYRDASGIPNHMEVGRVVLPPGITGPPVARADSTPPSRTQPQPRVTSTHSSAGAPTPRSAPTPVPAISTSSGPASESHSAPKVTGSAPISNSAPAAAGPPAASPAPHAPAATAGTPAVAAAHASGNAVSKPDGPAPPPVPTAPPAGTPPALASPKSESEKPTAPASSP